MITFVHSDCASLRTPQRHRTYLKWLTSLAPANQVSEGLLTCEVGQLAQAAQEPS